MIKDAKPKTIELVKNGWEENKIKLFARDGKKPNGGIGQDFKNNHELQDTVNKMAEKYIPLIARKWEIAESKAQNNDISQELDAINKQMVLLNRDFLVSLNKGNIGFEKEAKRHDANSDPMRYIVATGIIGSAIATILQPIQQQSSVIKPRDNFAVRDFGDVSTLGFN